MGRFIKFINILTFMCSFFSMLHCAFLKGQHLIPVEKFILWFAICVLCLITSSYAIIKDEKNEERK